MTWPVTLQADGVTLRPLRLRDRGAWQDVRARNRDWLLPWEATMPPEGRALGERIPTFATMVRRLQSEARTGHCLPWAIEVGGQLAGQLTVGGITLGSARTAYIGYWIDQALAGRGIMPTAVAMAVDYCFEVRLLHRIEINIRPENAPSRRVAAKLGLREEGLRPAFLHIDGDWRDHICYSVIAGDFPSGLLASWRSTPRVPKTT